MMKFATLLLLLMVIVPSLSSQRKDQVSPSLIPISYCELFGSPSRYRTGEEVRIKATWTYGFEWSYLSDRECLTEPKAMFELADEDRLCAASKKNVKKINHKGFDNKADVIVVGMLRDCGGCGHMSGYHYKFVVTCFESYKTIPANIP
jgi:hypothetical protein